jgi:hypothetical protein
MSLFSNAFVTRPLPENTKTTAGASPASASAALKTFFSNPSSIVLSVLIAALLVGKLAVGDWQWADLIAAVIIFAGWPLLEWLIHVVLLHNKPRSLFGRKIDFLLPQTHRWHHADPWNLEHVFIPLHIYPLVAPAGILLALLVLPLGLALTVLAVYSVLALHYEWVHYLSHISWCPTNKYYKRRVLEHRLHHFKSEQHWWGVSMGLGDVILGTAPRPSDISVSANTGDILATTKP